MAASSNDSQGLKIAVAAFVALSVILGVTTYFGWTYYGQEQVKRLSAESKEKNKNDELRKYIGDLDDLRKMIGARQEEMDPIKQEIKTESKKIDDDLQSIVAQINDAIGKAQAAGLTGPEIDDLKTKAAGISSAYFSQPNKTLLSSLDRMKELLKNIALLNNAVAINYTRTKRSLEDADGINKSKMDVLAADFKKAKDDLALEHDNHVKDRQILVTKTDELQTMNAEQATKIAGLESDLKQTKDDLSKKLALSQTINRELRDQVEKTENVLDRPDGVLTFIDYRTGEVRANVKRSEGALPQMTFAIFDRDSPGLPTDKPKGTIMLTAVGEAESRATIVKTTDPLNPFRIGDFVYSAAWSPNEPKRFAIIGKIDINRDGIDDRADLKRMIRAAGGIVDFDLPPPDVGKETGKLTGRDAWYITDDRPPLIPPSESERKQYQTETREYFTRKSEVLREARENGVRPITLEHLLSYLGYDMAAPVVGRAEAVDMGTLQRLMRPRNKTATPPAPGGTADDAAAPKPADDDKPAADPK